MHCIFGESTSWNYTTLGNVVGVQNAHYVVVTSVCALDIRHQSTCEVVVDAWPEEGRVKRDCALHFVEEKHGDN